MKETLSYNLTFVHPKTQVVLFSAKGHNSVQFRTRNLPRIGDLMTLDFELTVHGKKPTHSQTYRTQFRVVEVERKLYAHTPQFESGNPAYYEEFNIFWIKVAPITKEFAGTIRLVQRFYKETADKWREWFNSRRKNES